jgi:hypothetical protein
MTARRHPEDRQQERDRSGNPHDDVGESLVFDGRVSGVDHAAGKRLVLRVPDHDQQHQGVLESAVLGALADVRSDSPRLDPDPILSGIASFFPATWGIQKRCATSTDWVVMKRRRRPGHVADGGVDFIGRDDAELRIADLPPPLAADDGDLERVRRLRGTRGPRRTVR